MSDLDRAEHRLRDLESFAAAVEDGREGDLSTLLAGAAVATALLALVDHLRNFTTYVADAHKI